MCEYVVSTSCTSCPAAAVVATTELATATVSLRYDNPYIDNAKLKPNDMSFVIFFLMLYFR